MAQHPLVAYSPIVIANGIVYLVSDDGTLYAVDMQGLGKWKYQTNGMVKSLLTMTDGVLYFSCNDDYLYALQLSSLLGS